MTEADAAAGGGGSAATSKQPQSKRQRRKHVNPSNTWPQQPKIQTAEARAKANLRVAGLSNTTTTTPNAPVLDPKLDLHSPEVRFCRFLGAPEQRKRHLAVTNLQQYLKKRSDIESTTGISEMDLLKLWKGLWFTLYLADKVPVQEELAKRLAKLIWCVAGTEEEDEYAAQMYLDYLTQQDEDVIMENVIDTVENGDGDDDEEEEYNEENGVNSDEEEKEEDSAGNDEHVEGEQRLQEQEEEDEIPDELVQHCRGAHLAALFVKTFFRTIQREWGKMDKHRIDKFYTLVRLVLREIFSYMAARHWNRGIVFLFNDILREEVLFQVPNGLRCHLIDITMEELATVNMKAPMFLTEATFLDCLDPYFALAQNSDDSMVQGRVMNNIFAKFLDEYSVVSENEETEKVMDQVHVGTIAKFLFELGSDLDTQERYRKSLYDMHKKYLKRLKKVGKDVELDVGDSPENSTEAAEEDGIVEDVQAEDAKPKTRKRKASEDSIESNDASTDEPTPAAESKQSNKKKHKKKSPVNESTDDPVLAQEESKLTKKKHKKKKKKRKSSIGSDEGSCGGKTANNQEEIITISYSDQKKAAKDIEEQSSAKKKPKSTPAKSKQVKEMTSEEKRVKFGTKNHSKSYKASMKALKTVKHTPNKTPEHGILRSKIASPASVDAQSSKKKRSRKKNRKSTGSL
jgi:hypothetical protein